MAFELGNVVKYEWSLRFPDDVKARPRELSVVTRIIVIANIKPLHLMGLFKAAISDIKKDQDK